MCGIAGIFHPTTVDPRAVLRMADVIRHRGPDDEGYAVFAPSATWALGGADTAAAAWEVESAYRPASRVETSPCAGARLALGHRRLSILDLSPLGHQPMCYRDRYWIVYNGEVYNHLELREELERDGYEFRSHSDTEVILAAYDRWGVDCLQRFNGMWSLALYDTSTRDLVLARDRFGVKPLYYWTAPDGTLAFASEIKQFTALSGWSAHVNGQRAYDFLLYGLSDHSDETLFHSVYQLPPGHLVRLNLDRPVPLAHDRRLASTAWYRLEPKHFDGSFSTAVEQFRHLFVDAVRIRLRADVPVGSCLSGGLDSSSIVCAIHDLLVADGQTDADQKTFSACSTVAAFDERKWIDEVVRHTGVDAHYVYPSVDSLLSEAPRITWHQDEPFGSSSIFAQWHVFALARQAGVTVMLDGQGADEQLAGYHMFFGARLADLFRQLRWLELAREGAAIRRRHGYGVAALGRYAAPHLLPEAVVDRAKRWLGLGHGTPDWLDVDALSAQARNPFRAAGALGGSVRGMSHAQLTRSNLQMLLHWEDRNSMAHGIESRVPFLDYRLVEFVLGLPDDCKLFRGVTKRVLREAVQRSIPSSIGARMDKLGFVTPEEVWVRQVAPNAFRSRIEATLERCPTYFRPDALRREIEAIIAGTKPFSFLPWRVANFGEWHATFGLAG